MASIRDVAKKANVGPATVSRVLNNSGYVSEESRRRIEQAMMELDYTPNELARNLFRKKTGIVALLVPSISHPFFAAFVEKAEEALHSRGYKTMLCNTAKEENAELEYLDMLNRHIVDGIISGVHSLEIEEYQKIKKPIVALDRYLGADIPVVAVNHEKGGRMAAEELAGENCMIIDVGGQDTKVISLRDGMVYDFLMNDKCSAGTGKFLEIMANRLGVTLEELFDMAGQGTAIPISSLCTVFAETEIISYIGEGRERRDIAAGVVESVAEKVAQLAKRQSLQDKIILTGGLSNSPYFAGRLSEKLGKTVETREMGKYAGALGAAYLAEEKG